MVASKNLLLWGLVNSMQDLISFVGKPVEIRVYRKRYTVMEHIKIFRGVLSDVGSTMVCLRRKNGKCIWVPKPNFFRDSIEELSINDVK